MWCCKVNCYASCIRRKRKLGKILTRGVILSNVVMLFMRSDWKGIHNGVSCKRDKKTNLITKKHFFFPFGKSEGLEANLDGSFTLAISSC